MNNTHFKRHEENILAAEYLIKEKGYYCSSIHCSYYSVFQLLLHIHKLRDTDIFKNRNKLDTTGSHEKVIDETFQILLTRDRLEAGKFKRAMDNLKSNRKVADYNESYIDKTHSETVYQMAQNLIKLLSNILL
jgi:hypothetical protein